MGRGGAVNAYGQHDHIIYAFFMTHLCNPDYVSAKFHSKTMTMKLMKNENVDS